MLFWHRSVAVADTCNPAYSNHEEERHNYDEYADSDNSDGRSGGGNSSNYSNSSAKPPLIQSGVLRTNCIDCLDRTNVAQYAYGLAALGYQLCALGVTTSTKIDLDDPLADELMSCYERMGDTLAHQYGGSAAHNKVNECESYFNCSFVYYKGTGGFNRNDNLSAWKKDELTNDDI